MKLGILPKTARVILSDKWGCIVPPTAITEIMGDCLCIKLSMTLDAGAGEGVERYV